MRPPLDTAKTNWKRVWRSIRVARREARKAADDCMIFGSGFVRHYSDGRDPEHVPLASMFRKHYKNAPQPARKKRRKDLESK